MRIDRFLLTGVLCLGLAVFGRDRLDMWVDQTVIPSTLIDTSVEVRDRNGALLRAYTVADGRWRLGARADQVDPTYLKMLLAYEDKRFYQHNGVDARATLRAALQALWNGRVISGGSTLTMQVARLLEESGTGQWQGKLRQIRLALALERQLSKDDILTLYLTLAPYGGNVEGIRAASLIWFGKEPRRLTPAQAALLVALPQSPETRRPDRNPGAAHFARDRVLARLTKAGTLTPDAGRAALTEPVPHKRRDFPALAPHLTDRMTTAARHALRHDLTLDATLQAALETLASDSLRGKQDRLSIAIVVADHTTGEGLASVGSAGFTDARQGFIDMTRALRSPGSTLKPLVYALAFDQGLAQPETLIDDRPTAFGTYAPQNFDGQFRGEVRASEALQLSLNIPVVKLADALGPARVMQGLRASGATPVLPGGKAGLAVVLGGLGITLEDLVQLYAGLANGGQAQPLHWSLGEAPSQGARITSRASAWHVAHILSGIAPPVGAPLNRLAFKTGTSYGHRDTWAVGFDGRHVAGVWIGRPDGTPVPGAFGAEVAAPILFQVFQHVKPQLDPLPPPPPETLLLANADLPLPLQHFRPNGAAFAPPAGAPVLAFPPDGAQIALEGQSLTVKLRDGAPPFTVLANNAPVVLGLYRREVHLPNLDNGFLTLSVIDSEGRSARAEIQLK